MWRFKDEAILAKNDFFNQLQTFIKSKPSKIFENFQSRNLILTFVYISLLLGNVVNVTWRPWEGRKSGRKCVAVDENLSEHGSLLRKIWLSSPKDLGSIIMHQRVHTLLVKSLLCWLILAQGISNTLAWSHGLSVVIKVNIWLCIKYATYRKNLFTYI